MSVKRPWYMCENRQISGKSGKIVQLFSDFPIFMVHDMLYRHIVFDLEGTLANQDAAIPAYPGNFSGQFGIYTGIRPLLQGLNAMRYRIGAITFLPENEGMALFEKTGLASCISCFIHAGNDAGKTNRLFECYLEKTGTACRDILFVTSTEKGCELAHKAGVDFVLAEWSHEIVSSDTVAIRLKRPDDLAIFLGKSGKNIPDPWLSWAIELQFIAQAGQTYSRDPFDLERFDRIREIAAEIMTAKSGLGMEVVKNLFCNESGFQTPKLDTRAAIVENGQILLVRETAGKWSLPGGWVDVDQSIASNTIKEVKEEAGLDVEPVRLIAVLDGNRQQSGHYAYGICKVFVLCHAKGGRFSVNHETLESAFFPLDDLPPLFMEKNTEEQIRMCFLAAADEKWQVMFD